MCLMCLTELSSRTEGDACPLKTKQQLLWSLYGAAGADPCDSNKGLPIKSCKYVYGLPYMYICINSYIILRVALLEREIIIST